MKKVIKRCGKLLLAALLVSSLMIAVIALDDNEDNTDDMFQPFGTEGNVRLQGTVDVFDSLHEALAEASDMGLETFTLEVIGSVAEESSPLIQADMNVTLIGAEGEHTVTLVDTSTIIRVQNGGSLTLGSGTMGNSLTIDAPGTAVHVTDGYVSIRDGVILQGNSPNSGTVQLSGANAEGMISGGIIKGYRAALGLEAGARLSEIRGGEFLGVEAAVNLVGNGTRINLISGGVFLQEDPIVIREGIALYVQNGSSVGEISGGYFETARMAAVVIIRGGWVEKISGGEFVSTRVLSGPTNAGRTSAIHIQGEGYPDTGIGTIDGGVFHGGYFGILLIMDGSRIETISDGMFVGIVGLQNDQYGVVQEIIGGTFIGGNFGILNVNTIEKIGGDTKIRGIQSFGIFNHPLIGSRINEISGGMIVSEADHGIHNTGVIGTISGGTIIGELSAINNVQPVGEIGTISGGVFWGKNDVAIYLEAPLLLEPGLNSERGEGRYWGSNGLIFNDDALVVFPNEYHMSAATVQVEGVAGSGFRFLRLPLTLETVRFRAGPGGAITGVTEVEVPYGETLIAEQVPNPTPESGCVFIGWFKDGTRVTDILKLNVTEPLTLEARFIVSNPGETGGSRFPPLPDNPGGTWESGVPGGPSGSGRPWESGASGGSQGSGDLRPISGQRHAYLIGNPEGMIRPNDNITRAEAATIFFRLISDHARQQYWSLENPYSDVRKNDWFNNAVSTTTSMGLFQGVTSEIFAPGDAITRGELAAVIVRFMDTRGNPVITSDRFNDIADHWAREYINRAAERGWLHGNTGLGGAFRPMDPITRAEAAATINRIFGRLPESAADLLPGMISWPDNSDPDSWYYLYLQSASNSYVYERKSDGIHERWLTIIPTRDWIKLERPNSVPEGILE